MSKKLVLVVEDDEKQNEYICKIVEKLGYQTVKAYSGIEALEQLKKHRRGLNFLTNKISCILLDWQMPKMNGEQFLIILRKEEHRKPFQRHIPVVIITAYDDMEKRKQSSDSYLGMVADYIVKPFDEDQIKNILHKILVDKDNEILVEIYQEKTYKKDRSSGKLSDDDKKALEAYLAGENILSMKKYLENKLKLAEMEYTESFEITNRKAEHQNFLYSIKRMFEEELKRIEETI